ncbi:extensin-like [Ischnura elegans]|uniref:extensin-like n=1 Tax=Ischnura elegans TaxID=197161 RepID=UPI001ED8A406|nr:extensin-like [Ischnura elegans]
METASSRLPTAPLDFSTGGPRPGDPGPPPTRVPLHHPALNCGSPDGPAGPFSLALSMAMHHRRPPLPPNCSTGNNMDRRGGVEGQSRQDGGSPAENCMEEARRREEEARMEQEEEEDEENHKADGPRCGPDHASGIGLLKMLRAVAAAAAAAGSSAFRVVTPKAAGKMPGDPTSGGGPMGSPGSRPAGVGLLGAPPSQLYPSPAVNGSPMGPGGGRGPWEGPMRPFFRGGRVEMLRGPEGACEGEDDPGRPGGEEERVGGLLPQPAPAPPLSATMGPPPHFHHSPPHGAGTRYQPMLTSVVQRTRDIKFGISRLMEEDEVQDEERARHSEAAEEEAERRRRSEAEERSGGSRTEEEEVDDEEEDVEVEDDDDDSSQATSAGPRPNSTPNPSHGPPPPGPQPPQQQPSKRSESFSVSALLRPDSERKALNPQPNPPPPPPPPPPSFPPPFLLHPAALLPPHHPDYAPQPPHHPPPPPGSFRHFLPPGLGFGLYPPPPPTHKEAEGPVGPPPPLHPASLIIFLRGSPASGGW